MSEGIDPAVPPSGTGCVECERDAGWWLHLALLRGVRQDLGRCDTHSLRTAAPTPQRPATRSSRASSPVRTGSGTSARSGVTGPALAPPTSHPETQGVPGPVARAPADWQRILMER